MEAYTMKKGFLILFALPAAAAVIYLEGALFFANRFQFHTSLNGRNVSLMTARQTEAGLQGSADSYKLTIQGRDGLSDTITAKDIDLTATPGPHVRSALGRTNIFLWPVSLFHSTSYKIDEDVEFSEPALEKKISTLTFFDEANVRAPENAAAKVVDGKFQIVNGDAGTQLNSDKTLAAITEAITAQSPSLSLEDAGCYESAAVSADNEQLIADTEMLNRFAAVTITIPFGQDKEVAGPDVVSGWLNGLSDSSSENNAALTVADVFNRDKIASYVAELSKKYDTYGQKRTFTTASGDTISITAGDYGWWMDQSSTVDAIIKAIETGEDSEVEPVYFQKAFQYGSVDWDPDNFAEVDLDKQHVYIHKDGKIVFDTDCVSGKALAGNGTPDGIYSLKFKQRDTVLRGDNYASPVSYWMPFNRGVGFHDASWRSKFGGDIYVTRGSHGCVNLPVDAADDVYANVSSGEAVIVYGGLSQAQAVSYSGKPATSDGQSDLTANTAGNDPAAQADPAAAQAAADAVNKAQSADAKAQGADATAQAKAQADAQAQANAQVAQIAAQLQAAYMAQGMTPEQAAARAQADIAAAQAKAQAAAPAAGQ